MSKDKFTKEEIERWHRGRDAYRDIGYRIEMTEAERKAWVWVWECFGRDD